MSNKQKAALLGMPQGTAQHRLRKAVLFSILQETGKDNCFRCGQAIATLDELSMEHKRAWQGAPDPKAVFFDVKNIAFSHLRCNCGAARREATQCHIGHPFDEENTYVYPDGERACRRCHREGQRKFRAGHPEQSTSAYKREKGWL